MPRGMSLSDLKKKTASKSQRGMSLSQAKQQSKGRGKSMDLEGYTAEEYYKKKASQKQSKGDLMGASKAKAKARRAKKY